MFEMDSASIKQLRKEAVDALVAKAVAEKEVNETREQLERTNRELDKRRITKSNYAKQCK